MAKNNWENFKNWAVGRPCTDFIDFVNEKGDDFNYRALGRAANMPETGIRQNTKCRAFLKEKKQQLMALGRMVEKGDNNSSPRMDNDKPAAGKKGELTNPERNDYERLKEEVPKLKKENRDLKLALKRFGKMEQYLMEFGVLPR